MLLDIEIDFWDLLLFFWKLDFYIFILGEARKKKKSKKRRKNYLYPRTLKDVGRFSCRPWKFCPLK